MKNSKYLYMGLKKRVREGNVKLNELLSKHCSYKIGGKGKLFVEVASLEELIKVTEYLALNNIGYYVIGNGTKILFDDLGYDGVIIKVGEKFNRIERIDNSLICEAGASLVNICSMAMHYELCGMEDGFGIPGTIGGAVFMNASAFEYETKDVVSEVLAIVDNKITTFKNIDCEFAYRKSIFQKLNNCIIIRVQIDLKKGVKEDIINKMINVSNLRMTRQPLDKLTCGSIFKRLDGVHISKLLEDNGVKAMQVGGAKVSNKHANFIENFANAKSSDVIELINQIEQKIFKNENIELQREIIYLKNKPIE